MCAHKRILTPGRKMDNLIIDCFAGGGGATSWTADGEYDVTSWNCAKLAESEETVWQRSELQKN